MKICKIIFLYLVIGWIYLVKSSQIEPIRSENIIFILIFQKGEKSIFRHSFVRLNLIEYFEAIVFFMPYSPNRQGKSFISPSMSLLRKLHLNKHKSKLAVSIKLHFLIGGIFV